MKTSIITTIIIKTSIIKTTIIIVLGLLLQLSAIAQVDSVKIICEEEALSSVFEKLSDEYQLRFAYDAGYFSTMPVSVNITETDLNTALSQLFEQTNCDYKYINQTYVIIPKSRNSSSSVFIIKGLVRDSASGETLPHASVFTGTNGYGTTTNQEGYFTLMVPDQEDSIRVFVDYLGYKTRQVGVVKADNKDMITIELTPVQFEIDEVQIRKNTQQVLEYGRAPGQFTINTLAMKTLPGMGEVDVFRSLQFLPGISISNESSTELSIRGSSADQNLILFDGMPIYHLNHFFGFLSAINPATIKHVDVKKDGYEANYGGKVGGMVDITAINGNKNKAGFSIGANMISVNALFQTPIGKNASFYVAARQSISEFYKSKVFTQAFNTLLYQQNPFDTLINSGLTSLDDSHGFNFYDLNAKLTVTPSPGQELSLSLYTGFDNLFTYQDVEESYFIDEKKWGNRGISLKWNKQWNNSFYQRILAGYTDFSQKLTTSYAYFFSPDSLNTDYDVIDLYSQNRLTETFFRFENELKKSSVHQFHFGLSYTKNEVVYTAGDNEIIAEEDGISGGDIAGYLTWLYSPLPKLEIRTGLRSGFLWLAYETYFEPRLSLKYSLLSNFYITASAGLYHQNISNIEMGDQVIPLDSYWFIADNFDIPVVHSALSGIGLHYKSKDWSMHAEGFYRKVSDLSRYNWKFDTEVDTTFYNYLSYIYGEASVYGFDLTLVKESGLLSGWLAYSYSKNMNTFPDLNGGLPFAATNDQRHEIKAVTMLNLKSFTLSASWVFGSGKPYSVPSGFDPDYYSVEYNRINDKRLPPYHRMDLSASYHYSIGRMNAELIISLMNIYNRKNIASIYYLPDYGSVEPGFQKLDLSLMGFTPNIFLKIRF